MACKELSPLRLSPRISRSSSFGSVLLEAYSPLEKKSYPSEEISTLRTFFIDFITFANSIARPWCLFEWNWKEFLPSCTIRHQTLMSLLQFSWRIGNLGCPEEYLSHTFDMKWGIFKKALALLIKSLLDERSMRTGSFWFWFGLWQHLFGLKQKSFELLE